MTTTKLTTEQLESFAFSSLYDFDYYTEPCEAFKNDMRYKYLYGVAITSLEYYSDCRTIGTLKEVSEAALTLHDSFSKLCKYIGLTTDTIDQLERNIF